MKGTAVITHGRAKRRMIGYACEVAATMARTRVPELIAEALAADRATAVAAAAGGAGDADAAATTEPTEEVAT